jgi:pyocin large subunit-like protein
VRTSNRVGIALGALLLSVLGILFGPEVLEPDRTAPAAPTTAADDERAQRGATEAAPDVDASVGFTSRRALDEHFAKHGREFGSITKERYLRLAQELRDAPRSGPVREATRFDGVITRFDTRSGAFVAFHADRTIRTFFKPDDGLVYFERQLGKEHR